MSDQPDEFLLNLSPLPSPANPFRQLAQGLRTDEYDSLQQAASAEETAKYLEWLADKTPDVVGTDALVLMFWGRCACSYEVRRRTLEVIAQIDELVKSGPTVSGARPGKGGFKIPPASPKDGNKPG